MKLESSGKLAGIIVAIVCLTVLLVTGSISSDAGVGAIMALIGYLTGNGITALRGKPAAPVLAPREPSD